MKVINRGRYTVEKEGTKFYNTGSGISFCVKGGKTSVQIITEKGPGYVYVIRDFDYENREKILVENKKEIKIFFEDNNPHFVDLVKANEAADNYMIFGPVSSSSELLEIDEKGKKYFKVYGDSSIAGYGILSHQGKPDYLNNDGVENFCFRTLYSLGVDYDIFSASGWGITFSAWTDPKTVGIEKFRDKICINSDVNWNRKTPDFLIISLGTNDMSFMVENKENCEVLTEKFVKSYENLIKKERGKNLEIPVLMVYGSLKEDWVYPMIEKTYKYLSEKYPNIYIVKLPGDNSAIDNHSFVSYHPKMAEVLKEKIVQILSQE